MPLIADNQSAKVEKPSPQSLHFPAASITTQGASILCGNSAALPMGRDHFRPVLLHQTFVQFFTIVRLVANQTLWNLGNNSIIESRLHQFYFSRRSAFCPQGDRKTMAVCNAHDFAAFSAFGFPDLEPPFLAGTKVPSTKHSLRSIPPASLRCSARVRRTFSITPERTQFWKRRCAVWYGPYLGGRSCHGAPVRSIHSTPLKTLRRSLHGRPRPSWRTGSIGRMGSMRFHCWSVKSIHNYLYTIFKSTRQNLPSCDQKHL